jgi:hypothetical protein
VARAAVNATHRENEHNLDTVNRQRPAPRGGLCGDTGRLVQCRSHASCGVGGLVLYAPPGPTASTNCAYGLAHAGCQRNGPAGAGSWHDADRSVTARRSFFSWSQTVAEPGQERARQVAVRRADWRLTPSPTAATDQGDLRDCIVTGQRSLLPD